MYTGALPAAVRGLIREINMYSLSDFFLTIYRSPLRSIRVWILCFVITWTLLSIVCSLFRSLRKPWMILNCILFAVCVIVILRITLFRHSSGRRIIYPLPFYAFYLAQRQPELYRSMLMNVFLFVPFGLTIPYVSELPADERQMNRNRLSGRLRIMLCSVLAAAAFSFCIEFLQAVFALGTAETDDIIMNSVGAAIGTCPYLVRIRNRRSSAGASDT